MREVLFKNLSSSNPRKKDIVLRERFEKDGMTAQTERRCFYFIRSIDQMSGGNDFEGWLATHNQDQDINKRHFHIFKEHNDSLGADKVICKIAGRFYAVVGQKVYTIAFLHSFKAVFLRTAA